MDLLQILKNRRSVRTYTGQAIPEEKLTEIIQAGLSSATGRGKRPWEFYVVTDKGALEKLSAARAGSAKMLLKAGAAIVVAADAEYSDTWIEDCSICMANMHLMADYLGFGSCWIQLRGRNAENGNETSEAYVRKVCGISEKLSVEAMLSVGVMEGQKNAPSSPEKLMSKVHFIK